MVTQKRLIWTVVITTTVAIMVPVGVIGGWMYSIWRAQRQLDAVPLNPANFRPAAIDLVKLVQSDPSISQAINLQSSVAPPVPVSISRLNPETLTFEPQETQVIWGGGFYHCGWKLKPLRHAIGDEWELWFWNENGTEKLLQTFSVPRDAHFTPSELGMPTTKPTGTH